MRSSVPLFRRIVLVALSTALLGHAAPAPSPISFELKTIPFRLENSETSARHAPATMAGGCAVFDYNKDGRPDIFFTNGANIETLKKESQRYSNRLFRNDGKGSFTDVTQEAGLAGTGYDIAAAVGDYDNDGYPDLFVGGVHGKRLYHNNGDGTFSDVTAKAGLDRYVDPEYGPLWTVAAAWVDVNNDGLLDLVVINYLRWDVKTEKLCPFAGANDYCNPQFYHGQPNQLFLNSGDGTFRDVSEEWGLRAHVGKGMGGASPTTISTAVRTSLSRTTTSYNFLFHNTGRKFEEVAFRERRSARRSRQFHLRHGAGFPRLQQRRLPRHYFRRTQQSNVSSLSEPAGKDFGRGPRERATRAERSMSGYRAGIFDFDNDGWKDLFVSRGHVESIPRLRTPSISTTLCFAIPARRGNGKR